MVNPVISFLIGFLFAVALLVLFYFGARINSNASNLYKQTVCSGLF